MTFTDLPPDTEYRILVYGPQILEAGPTEAVDATTTVRTAVAPTDYTPLLRGPQNLRATATHDTITVTWDPPFEGASPKWSMAMLDGEILVHSARGF